jgi:1,4-alpha-glucan branching enzyme
VAELVWRARRAELRVTGSRGRPSEAAARELLALQSSDWAFLMTRALAADYPLERTAAHERALDEALAALRDSGAVPDRAVRNLAPDLDVTPLCAP